MSNGGVTSGNPGPDAPMILPSPGPPLESHAGPCDPSTSATQEPSDINEILPGREASAMPRLGSADLNDLSTDTATDPAIAAVADDGAAVYDDLIANAVDMKECHEGANANPSTKLEVLRAQGQALASIAHALLMQIQALNKQVNALL